MIELSDFLGNILSQVSEARKHADEASIALAEYYAQDKLLSCLPMPRVRLPNIELTIPVAIKEVKHKTAYNPYPGLPKKEIVRTIFRTMYTEESRRNEELPNRLPKGFITINKKLIQNTDKLSAQLRKSNEVDANVLDDYLDNCIKKASKIMKPSQRGDIKNITQLKARLKKELLDIIPMRQGMLSNLGITVQTNEIKELDVAGGQPITMKLFIKEDSFELVRKNEEGNDNNVKGKELDNYYIALE